MVDQNNWEWCRSADATVWANKWAEIIRHHPDVPFDQGTMLGWFANAIMAGYYAAKAQDRDEIKRLHDLLSLSNGVIPA